MSNEKYTQSFWVPIDKMQTVFAVCEALSVPIKKCTVKKDLLTIIFGFKTYDFVAYTIFETLRYPSYTR